MLSVATVTEPMGRTYYANASENYYMRDATALDRWQGNLCRRGIAGREYDPGRPVPVDAGQFRFGEVFSL